MATAISSAFNSNAAEDEDSYKPHRAPPPIPTVAYTTTAAARAPELGARPIYQGNNDGIRVQNAQYQQGEHSQPRLSSARGRPDVNSYKPPASPPSPGAVPGPRRGSFSFLRRSPSSQPSSRSAQAAATPRKGSNAHQPQPSSSSITSSAAGSVFRTLSQDGKSERNMLRKQSKLKQQQQADLLRQQRATQEANRYPPRLPQPARLPGIDTFGGEDARPDSVSTFNHAYTDPSQPPAIPGNAANFSRVGMAPAGYSNNNNGSSSPAYALRGAGSSPPSAAGNGDFYDSAGVRTSSMTNRGRYSYASSTAQAGQVNGPRRVRRRKDPTPFNVLVIGTKNSGKTSFITFLRNTLALRGDKHNPPTDTQASSKGAFTSQYLETGIDGERVGVTLWDSAGFEKNIVDLQLREMTAFIESKFEETFTEEQKVMRSPGFKDTHIHCVFLVLDPVRLDSNVKTSSTSGRGTSGLDEDVDLQVLRGLWGKTTVIPVVAKADTLTTNHMAFLKRAVWDSIRTAKLNPLDALELEDESDEEDEGNEIREIDEISSDDDAPPSKSKRPSHARQASLSSTSNDEEPYIPMSILSPDPYSMPPYTKSAAKSQNEMGRRYAWGFASPFDPQHCDFIRLRDTIFSEWRVDLRELSRVKWYEQWRTSRLRNVPSSKPRAKANSNASHSLPIRGTTDRQAARNFSSGAQSVPRTVSSGSQAVAGAAQPVGMAITTSAGASGNRF